MLRSQRRLIQLLVTLPVLVVTAALLYMGGMAWLERAPRTFVESLQWAGGAISTTGYGPDTLWHHPVMAVFVVAVEFVGVFLLFLIFPIYLIPFLEERFESRLPTEATDLAGHVLVFRFGPAVAMLLAELERVGIPALVLEEEEAVARRLAERGFRVVLGRLEDGVLERVSLARARAVVANGTDDGNAALILGVRQADFQGDVLALVEEPFHRKPMLLAGATAAFTPRHILGAALAERASRRMSPAISGLQPLGHHLQVGELRIVPRSPLAGRTLAEAAVAETTGVRVIGQWQGGHLRAPLSGADRISPHGSLVVAGDARALERLREIAEGDGPRGGGPFIIAGFGEVGQKVVELLRAVGEECLVVDRAAAPGVDRVGNMLDHELLAELPVASAQGVVLALDSDSTTLFATVILRDLVPDLAIVARVNQAENVEKIHRAGADFALSISHVSGQMLAHHLLGEDAVAVDARLRVQRVSAAAFAGLSPAAAAFAESTGCTLVAVERGEEVLTDLPEGFRFAAADQIYLCGSGTAVQRLEAARLAGTAAVSPARPGRAR